jgi:hypothetical protein
MKPLCRVFTIEVQQGTIRKEKDRRPEIEEDILFLKNEDKVGKNEQGEDWNVPVSKFVQQNRKDS